MNIDKTDTKCPIKLNNVNSNNGSGVSDTENNTNQIVSPCVSEITIREFLDFLKTAYQVHDNLEGLLLENGLNETVDWIKLKENDLVKPKDVQCQTSDAKIKTVTDLNRKKLEVDDAVKAKLSEILNEGLLDSILPYIIPQNEIIRKSSHKLLSEKSSSQSTTSNDRINRRKSTDATASSSKTSLIKNDSEVEIHVHDEVKNIKKDFLCNQKLLVEQMGYFAEVTMGQRLEDMDISVHCDVTIFEWLMRWVKRGSVLEEDQPKLDVNCAIPVLVSAAFLQMEPLLADCLQFCHENMNEILRTSTTMSCLNDVVLTRLAAMYTNREVEEIKDKKDKIQSKLFCKLILSLCDAEPEALRGHFSTLGKMYRCGRCFQLVSPSIEENIPCVSSCMRLEPDGAITSHHVRDSSWSITEYVSQMQRNLKSWRKVYWRLWGSCHFLICVTCKKYFPAKQIGWCRFHTDIPQFFTLDAQRAPLPVGRYPCCGERAYRFQPLEDQSGCHFREHLPCTNTVRETAIIQMLEDFRNLIVEEPPQLLFPERLTRLVARDAGEEDGRLECKEVLWWDGLELIQPRPKLGLLSLLHDNSIPEVVMPEEKIEEPPSTLTSEDDNPSDSISSCTSTSHCSEESPHSTNEAPPFVVVKNHHVNKRSQLHRYARKRTVKKRTGLLWQSRMSARSNQDMQRSNEEVNLKKITNILSRKTFSIPDDTNKSSTLKAWNQQAIPHGGIWVRLEAEWKDSHTMQTPLRTKTNNVIKSRLKTGKLN